MEPVITERQLLAVLRYILNNPPKAGICAADTYRWSSYHCYGDEASFVDTSLFMELLGDRDVYRSFISAPNEDMCLEYIPETRDDAWAKAVADRMGFGSGTRLQAFDNDERNAAIGKLLRAGLSIRQIERLTGISRGIIQRIKK